MSGTVLCSKRIVESGCGDHFKDILLDLFKLLKCLYIYKSNSVSVIRPTLVEFLNLPKLT